MLIINMTIVSISLNDKILKELDSMCTKRGYSGRSEIIRTAIRDMVTNQKEIEEMNGNVDGVLIISNKEKYNEDVSRIRHKYVDLIKIQVHNHMESVDSCLQIFVINGPADKTRSLINDIKTSKKVEYVKMFLV